MAVLRRDGVDALRRLRADTGGGGGGARQRPPPPPEQPELQPRPLRRPAPQPAAGC